MIWTKTWSINAKRKPGQLALNGNDSNLNMFKLHWAEKLSLVAFAIIAKFSEWHPDREERKRKGTV